MPAKTTVRAVPSKVGAPSQEVGGILISAGKGEGPIIEISQSSTKGGTKSKGKSFKPTPLLLTVVIKPPINSNPDYAEGLTVTIRMEQIGSSI